MDCICEEWINNIDLVNAPQRLAYARNPSPANEYRGVKFRHCPWCGNFLNGDANEPPPGLLMSMAVRYDHGLGVPGYYDQVIFSGIGDGEGGVTHAMRLESTMRTMRQLWEEVTGRGFYRPQRSAMYDGMATAGLSKP